MTCESIGFIKRDCPLLRQKAALDQPPASPAAAAAATSGSPKTAAKPATPPRA